MSEFKVTYAGLPESAKKVIAESPKEAAKTFFSANPERRTIFVNAGMFQEEVYKWSDFPEIDFPLHDSDSSSKRKAEGTIVRTYEGDHTEAVRQFQADAIKLEQRGYFPISQNYTQGEYGCGAFLVALLLCFVLVGIIVFIYMMIVKPSGSLIVTYKYRETVKENPKEKTCIRCAENVKFAAKVCRFCGYEFEPVDK